MRGPEDIEEPVSQEDREGDRTAGEIISAREEEIFGNEIDAGNIDAKNQVNFIE